MVVAVEHPQVLQVDPMRFCLDGRRVGTAPPTFVAVDRQQGVLCHGANPRWAQVQSAGFVQMRQENTSPAHTKTVIESVICASQTVIRPARNRDWH